MKNERPFEMIGRAFFYLRRAANEVEIIIRNARGVSTATIHYSIFTIHLIIPL